MTNIKRVPSAAATPGAEAPPRRRGRPARSAAPAPSREVLLEQAFDRFAERGFEAVSVRELAAELGVSDSLFHHHFGSKERLWSEAVAHVIGPLQAAALAALAEGGPAADPLERLRESTRRVLMWGWGERRVLRLIFREAGADSPRGVLMRQYFEAYQRRVEPVLLEAQRQGRIRPLPLDAAHAMIVGAARSLVDPGLLADRLAAVRDEAAMRALVDGIVDTLYLGLLARP